MAVLASPRHGIVAGTGASSGSPRLSGGADRNFDITRWCRGASRMVTRHLPGEGRGGRTRVPDLGEPSARRTPGRPHFHPQGA